IGEDGAAGGEVVVDAVGAQVALAGAVLGVVGVALGAGVHGAGVAFHVNGLGDVLDGLEAIGLAAGQALEGGEDDGPLAFKLDEVVAVVDYDGDPAAEVDGDVGVGGGVGGEVGGG